MKHCGAPNRDDLSSEQQREVDGPSSVYLDDAGVATDDHGIDGYRPIMAEDLDEALARLRAEGAA